MWGVSKFVLSVVVYSFAGACGSVGIVGFSESEKKQPTLNSRESKTIKPQVPPAGNESDPGFLKKKETPHGTEGGFSARKKEISPAPKPEEPYGEPILVGYDFPDDPSVPGPPIVERPVVKPWDLWVPELIAGEPPADGESQPVEMEDSAAKDQNSELTDAVQTPLICNQSIDISFEVLALFNQSDQVEPTTQCSVEKWNSPATSCTGQPVACGSMPATYPVNDQPETAAAACALAAKILGAGTCCTYHLYGQGTWYLTGGKPQVKKRPCFSDGSENNCRAGGPCELP